MKNVRPCPHGVGRLILASSSEVYQSPPHVPTDERTPLVVPDPLNPRLSYGAGKIISEMMVINHGRKHFERVLIFRPHNVYGPDMPIAQTRRRGGRLDINCSMERSIVSAI